MNIIEAMESPTLFGPFFKRGIMRDVWAPWKSFLRALYGLPLSPADRARFKKHTGRDDLPQKAFRECYCIVGRRGGKSRASALLGAFAGAFTDYRPYVAPGEIPTVLILSADRAQARIVLSYLSSFFAQVPALRSMVRADLKESIELHSGLSIEVATSDYRSLRGRTVVLAILDELAFFRSSETGANSDAEIVNALRPAMATIPNALLIGLSSPYSRRGVLWENFRTHFGKTSDVLIWKASSREMNPSLSRATVAMAYAHDAAAAAAEYGAEFRSDLESFLPVEVIEALVPRGLDARSYSTAHSYMAFVDPSGGRSDSMTLAIAHGEDEVAVLDVTREIRAPFSPEAACDEFAQVLRSFHISECVGDRYAGEWPAEQFAKRGISYRVSERSKSELYLSFLPLATSKRCELLDIARLKNQLASLERRTARAGRDSVDHPVGGRDDLANAAAGACVLAAEHSGTFGLLDFFASGAAEELLREMNAAPARKSVQIERPTSAPHGEGQCCSSPLPQRIANDIRCANCGAQRPAPGAGPSHPHGVTFADLNRLRGGRRF